MSSDPRAGDGSHVLQMGDLRPREHVHLGASTLMPFLLSCAISKECFLQQPLLGFAQNKDSIKTLSRGTTRISGSLSCGAREVRSPCAWRGGARPGSRVTGGD